jgi:PTH1 family peptidyl-tRNA hydrolase
MIKLIVGLGNPGQQYKKTRHNAGFWFLEGLANGFSVSWGIESRFEGEVSNILVAAQKVILLKPQTFMNLSGRSVGKLSRYFKIAVEEILVVHDELDFDPGVVRLKKSGGHAGHNGLRDIVASLGSKDFYRLRVGIGRPQGQQKVVDYVLSEPSREDKSKILNSFVPVYSEIESIVKGDFEKVMTSLHNSGALK